MRVIKLGGSLLELPDLRSRLTDFLGDSISSTPSLFLVGGGNVVEAIRDYDRRWLLDEAACHWLCVQLMNATAKLLHLLFPDWPLIVDSQRLEEWVIANAQQSTDVSNSRLAIVAPDAFYSPHCNAESLPKSWQTTSDSIAAILAKVVRAEEIVLLKSVDPPLAVLHMMEQSKREKTTRADNCSDVSCLASDLIGLGSLGEFVDDAFLSAIPQHIRVFFVNLKTLK